MRHDDRAKPTTRSILILGSLEVDNMIWEYENRKRGRVNCGGSIMSASETKIPGVLQSMETCMPPVPRERPRGTRPPARPSPARRLRPHARPCMPCRLPPPPRARSRSRSIASCGRSEQHAIHARRATRSFDRLALAAAAD